MIKFIMTGDKDRKILGIMLSEANILYLKRDRPIHFNAEEMGLSKLEFHEVAIFYDETEEKFKKTLEKMGKITDETIIHKTKERIKPQ